MRTLLLIFSLSFLSCVAFAQTPNSSAPRILEYVEQMPEFPGNIQDYIQRNTVYPKAAIDSNIEGRVIVRFVIDENGNIRDAKVVRGIGGGCDEEALRVINSMPRWKPGKQNGKAVSVFFTQPFTFRFDHTKTEKKR